MAKQNLSKLSKYEQEIEDALNPDDLEFVGDLNQIKKASKQVNQNTYKRKKDLEFLISLQDIQEYLLKKTNQEIPSEQIVSDLAQYKIRQAV